jgi:hypothetical protein
MKIYKASRMSVFLTRLLRSIKKAQKAGSHIVTKCIDGTWTDPSSSGLFVSFRNSDRTWGEPRAIGLGIPAGLPLVSPAKGLIREIRARAFVLDVITL